MLTQAGHLTFRAVIPANWFAVVPVTSCDNIKFTLFIGYSQRVLH